MIRIPVFLLRFNLVEGHEAVASAMDAGYAVQSLPTLSVPKLPDLTTEDS